MIKENLRQLNLSEWELVGGGANSDSYFHKTDPGIMLKLNAKPEDEDIFAEEFNTAEKILKLNINTPKAYELVEADGGLGIIYERIKGKQSIASLCAENPAEIEKYASIFAGEAKKLHSTPCDREMFKDHSLVMEEVLLGNELISKAQVQKLLAFTKELPFADTCLHQDMQPGNLVLDENGNPYWIDLGGLDFGNPVYDMGLLYCMCKAMPFHRKLINLTHMNSRQLLRFWNAFEAEYLGSTAKDDIKEFERLSAYANGASILYRMTLHEKSHDSGMDKAFYRALFSLVVLPE